MSVGTGHTPRRGRSTGPAGLASVKIQSDKRLWHHRLMRTMSVEPFCTRPTEWIVGGVR